MPDSAPQIRSPVSGVRFLGITVLLPVTIRHCRVNTLVYDSEFIPVSESL